MQKGQRDGRARQPHCRFSSRTGLRARARGGKEFTENNRVVPLPLQLRPDISVPLSFWILDRD